MIGLAWFFAAEAAPTKKRQIVDFVGWLLGGLVWFFAAEAAPTKKDKLLIL